MLHWTREWIKGVPYLKPDKIIDWIRSVWFDVIIIGLFLIIITLVIGNILYDISKHLGG